jgi:hypothetical protein
MLSPETTEPGPGLESPARGARPDSAQRDAGRSRRLARQWERGRREVRRRPRFSTDRAFGRVPLPARARGLDHDHAVLRQGPALPFPPPWHRFSAPPDKLCFAGRRQVRGWSRAYSNLLHEPEEADLGLCYLGCAWGPGPGPDPTGSTTERRANRRSTDFFANEGLCT